MISIEDSRSLSHSNPNITNPYAQTRHCYYYTPPPSSARISRSNGRSMRTVRSNIFSTAPLPIAEKSPNVSENLTDVPLPIAEKSPNVSENLTDSVIDIRLGELASKPSHNSKTHSSSDLGYMLEISTAFSDFSACSSDISVELQRLANIHDPGPTERATSVQEPCSGFLQRETFSMEIIESISPEDLQPTVKLCVDALQSPSIDVRRSAAAKLRLLAKHRADNRALIGESGAVSALISLLRCSDPATQEHAVTALFNLSLHESNKNVIANAGGIKALIYVLKTGTETSKQNAACALLSLALDEEYKLSIGASGAIPPLVALLMSGSDRGKKDALTTLYKLCSVRLNKERAVTAGAVRQLVGLVMEQGSGLAEKAMVVLSSLGGIKMGQVAIAEEGGIPALVESIEDGSDKGKEFAVFTLLQICAESVRNRGLLVREGGIPPLVALSQSGTAKAKYKAERLLGYLREARPEASCSSSRDPN